MADFISPFWHWFIIILTAGGIIGMILLLIWMSERPGQGEFKAKPMGHVWDKDLQELNNPLPRWWANFFYITIIFSIIYLVLYPGMGSFQGILGWSQVGQYEKQVKEANRRFAPIYKAYKQVDMRTLVHDAGAMKTAARLFVNNCSLCHGSDAGGSPGFPSLRDRDWLYGGSPEAIKESILNGRKGVMPAWEAALGQKGVHEVAEYVLSLSGRRVDINAAQVGKTKYKQMCASCHGGDARGNKQLGAPNLADNVWLYGGSQKTVMHSIAKGRQGNMPAHRNFLGEAKAHLLAAYVYSLSAENLTQ